MKFSKTRAGQPAHKKRKKMETNENQIPVNGSPIMPERDSDYWDEQKEFFKHYE